MKAISQLRSALEEQRLSFLGEGPGRRLSDKASIQFRLDDELPEDDIRDVIRRAVSS